MSCVLALQRHWDVRNDVQFEVKGNFEALRASVNDASTAAFMWENFMSKPYHDSGDIKKIGEIVRPWPCFMMAARAPTISARLDDIHRVLAAIQGACAQFAHEPAAMQARIVEQFHLTAVDAALWYSRAHITGT